MKQMYFVAILSLTLQVSACNYFTFTPRHRSQKQREKPSIFICERIVDFRLEEGRWPGSKDELISKGKKYYDAFKGFRYNYTSFKIKDSNTMIFYFGEHIADEAYAAQTNRTDLNAYGGKVHFFKAKEKFAYKIKMN